MLDKINFKKIFDTYFDPIRSYIYYRCGDSDLASDIAQNIFMKVWEKREQLSDNNIKPLLYKIANDMVISDYRKQISQLNFVSEMKFDEQDSSPHDDLQFEELKMVYSAALNEMPENQRLTFLLSRNDELKYHEIAERLDISVKAVEKRMSAALKFLKIKLLNDEN